MPCILLSCSNIYRGSKEAFALDPKALRWSLHLLVGPDCSRHFLSPPPCCLQAKAVAGRFAQWGCCYASNARVASCLFLPCICNTHFSQQPDCMLAC